MTFGPEELGASWVSLGPYDHGRYCWITPTRSGPHGGLGWSLFRSSGCIIAWLSVLYSNCPHTHTQINLFFGCELTLVVFDHDADVAEGDLRRNVAAAIVQQPDLVAFD